MAASTLAASIIAPLRADDLIMPYMCELDHGAPRLSASGPNIYHIIGPRQDQGFSSCAASPAGTCEMMMVHKFTIGCGGKPVAWSRVASAARALGVEMPDHLPPGFAPISRLAGRFVLPGYFAAAAKAMPHVSAQELSPDSVTETREAQPRSEPRPEPAQWITVVDSAAKPSAPEAAFKVGGVVTALVLSLMAACLFLAQRPLSPSFEGTGLPEGDESSLAGRMFRFAKSTLDGTVAAFRQGYESWRASADGDGSRPNLEHALTHLYARLAETELLVSTLPADMLLREVLRSELDGLRERSADVARRVRRLGGERSSAILRALSRDLDRIARIVHGAAKPAEHDEPLATAAPASRFEAYRVLGLNPDAPDAAVKKVVDALRMSWHPDHARNEADRIYREQRIKQINAAWDLLKVSRAAAA